MKKSMSALVILLVLVCLSGCGKLSNEEKTSDDDNKVNIRSSANIPAGNDEANQVPGVEDQVAGAENQRQSTQTTPGLGPTVAGGAQLVEEYSDKVYFEGPSWDPVTGKLYFVAWGEPKQLRRLDSLGQATVWVDQTEGINGTFISNTGRMITAEVFAHKICSYRITPDGPDDTKVLAFDETLNQPNDLCQSPSGHIYFTDPDWKNHKTSGVYHLSPDGTLTKVVDDMTAPNGIICSLDGKTLYVGDSVQKHWKAFAIQPDGLLGQGRVFFDPETENRKDPDGMTIDENGNLYFTGRGGIWIVSAEAKLLGFIPVPEFCSNVTFGGPDGKILFITCQDKVYSLAMAVRGGSWEKTNQ
ncbi:MAG: SMP-30/gluconolactonase/LRE family protein [Sedimentisphaerales bacterium]|nr:SMP-30/gluconolactonase/LRE family protein [Sedimentisphaerales bacterium]